MTANLSPTEKTVDSRSSPACRASAHLRSGNSSDCVESAACSLKAHLYYERDGISIYHGDCRDILPALQADVVLADLPYNAGKKYGRHNDDVSDEAHVSWCREILAHCCLAAPEIIFFPGLRNAFSLSAIIPSPLRPHRLLGWHKKEFAGDKFNAGPAMCWEPIVWATRSDNPRYNKRFGHAGRDFLVVRSTHGNPFARHHPCPKPLEVMTWLAGLFVPEPGICIDPVMGTGTTLRACKDLGFRAIGIELEERFCELAIHRLEQGVLAFEEAGRA